MIKIGPSGLCKRFEEEVKDKIKLPKWLSKNGLTAFEYQFNFGIDINAEESEALGKEFLKYNIELSAHAPYFINFANPDESRAEKSYRYVVSCLKRLKLMGGKRLVVHVGSIGKIERSQALKLCCERLNVLKEKIIESGLSDMMVCFESLGKEKQIGTHEEVIELCKLAPFYYVCLDFGHINSITQGALKSESDYEKIFKLIKVKLGIKKLKKIHIHFTKIEYGPKGEIKHLNLNDTIYGPEFEPLVKTIKKLQIEPVIICESHECATNDAKEMNKIIKKIK